MDIPTRPGDVLAQATRADLFSLLAELRRPASTDELAERLELHPNGVRVHLERLHQAGWWRDSSNGSPGDGRVTSGRSVATRSRVGIRRPRTPTSGAGWCAPWPRARCECARWR